MRHRLHICFQGQALTTGNAIDSHDILYAQFTTSQYVEDWERAWLRTPVDWGEEGFCFCVFLFCVFVASRSAYQILARPAGGLPLSWPHT